MIVAVAVVIADDGSASARIIDLDKVPKDNYFRKHVEEGMASEHKVCGSIYGEFTDDEEEEFQDAEINPPCHIDDAVVFHME